MANDIVASPEPFAIRARVLYLSPLSDYEMCAVENWIKWITDGKCEDLTSDEAHQYCNSIAGAVVLLYWSVRRTHRISMRLCSEIVGDDQELASEIYSFWFNLNISQHLDQLNKLVGNSTLKSTASKTESATVNSTRQIYCDLMQRYNKTANEISELTRVQQFIMWVADIEETPQSNKFATEKEYFEALAKRQQNGR